MSIILLTFSKNYLCSWRWKQKRLEGREVVDKENILTDLENGKKIFVFSASKYTFEKKNVSSVKRGDVMFARIISKLRRHVKKNVATYML
jgi:hypothetical protein